MHAQVYNQRPPRILDDSYFDVSRDEGMGWVGSAIGAGTSILGPLIGKLFAPCGGANVACGLQGITSFGNQAIQTLQQILQMVSSNPPMVSPQEAISNAQRIAAALSDGTVVYQAKKGKDAAALTQFKSQAAQLVQQITAAATAKQAQLQQQAASPLGGSGGGITSTAFMIGGGLMLLLLLRRK